MIGGYWILFDIAALVLDMFMLVCMLLRRLNNGRKGRALFALMTVNTLSCIFDILSVIPGNPILSIVSNSLYFSLHSSLPLMQLIYIIFSTESSYKFFRSKKIILSTMLPAGLLITANSFLNPIFHWFYSIDPNTGSYTRGPLMWVAYLTAFLYITICIYFTIKYRKHFLKGEAITFYLMPLIVIIALVLQGIFPNVLIEMYSISLILIVYLLFAESPDELSDQKTGVYTFKKFKRDVEMTVFSNDEKKILILCIDNYDSMKSLTNRLDLKNLVESISLTIREKATESLKFADTYYLGKGVFAILFDRANMAISDQFMDDISTLTSLYKNSQGMEYRIEFKKLEVKVPTEAKNFKELERLMNYIIKSDMDRNSVTKYSELSTDQNFLINYNIDKIIKHALDNDKFEVYIQPIYNVKENKIENGEALLRLYDDKYGQISPGALIPAAERNSSIVKISSIVFEKLLQFTTTPKFKSSGIKFIEMNLSIQNLLNANLMDDIMSISRNYVGADDYVNFEITESEDGYEIETVQENIKRITDYGFTLALDDYGTGYSNIGRLVDLPFSIVKLDFTLSRKYIDPKMRTVIEDTISLIHRLGLKIVIEGVETEDMLKYFVNVGADYIQGYYFSKALPMMEFLEYVRDFNSKNRL